MSDQNVSTEPSAIDLAIAKAKARKAARAAGGETEVVASTKAAKQPKAEKVVDLEKLAAKELKLAERAAAKFERDAARDIKRQAKLDERKPANLTKVERAESKLPKLSDAASFAFNQLTLNHTSADLATMALHIQHFNRANATQRAATTKLTVGNDVRITGGDPRYVGMIGTVAKAQRIRCYVTVEGLNKDVYLFTSDVEVLDADVCEATGTEG